MFTFSKNNERVRDSVSAFICVTPLQLHIAANIIKLENIENYVLININPHDSLVLRNYFEIIAKGALQSDLLFMRSRLPGNYFMLKRALNKWEKYNITAIYASSISNVWVQHIINMYKSAKITSFDDGSVNLSKLGEFVVEKKLNVRQRIVYYLLRGRTRIGTTYTRISRHYTIYRDSDNIIPKDRCYFINVFKEVRTADPRFDKIKVFLGFVPNNATYFQAVEWVNPDIYIPHPMEKARPPHVKCVETDLLAEMYILNLLNDYKQVDLYSCASTVLLNLNGPCIKKYVIDLWSGENDLQNEFNRLATTFGSNILPFTTTGFKNHNLLRVMSTHAT